MALSGSKRMSALEETDLPEPDSPTMAKVSLELRVKLTF